MHCKPALFRKRHVTPEEVLLLFLLLRRQVLANFHAIEDSLLLIWSKRIEHLQPLPQLLLLVSRKVLELRIALKHFFLLVGRHVVRPPEPIAGMWPWPHEPLTAETWSILWRIRLGLALLLPLFALFLPCATRTGHGSATRLRPAVA